MTEQSKTIAVVGASPFAWLLAGLLAADHSRAVVLLGPPPNPHLLRAVPSLTLAPIARPQTWSLLRAHTRPAVRRLMRIAPGIGERIDMQLSARSADAAIALGHIYRTADGFGFPIDPPVRTGSASVLTLRDVRAFNLSLLLSAAPAWLASVNVALVNSTGALKLKRDGSASFGTTTIDQVVLADDAAIIDWLEPDEIAHFARIEQWIGIETAPQRHHRYRVGLDLDSGAIFAQAGDGIVRAAARDDDALGIARIASALPFDPAPRLAARAHFRRLATHDGAPVLGPTRRGRLFVVAGLGPLDIVLAPLVATIIAEKATGTDAQWAAAHGTDRRQPRRDVAEVVPGHLPGGGA
ncbi:hypothetical protein NO932_05600 [Pelagibacterium sp. 26DY04]|uniref:hypothetical protein n=1 Tax=Pelagibacterium sp. 26DY04 TaxID=2967130 RepID=UPI0028150F03|nr:hypothetical protein [Pelagibacterium sp. 26DY04]WMT88083.1 hypothetical protein NO932_05600 [Pelagibacterium sp. 26DY04]